MSSNLRIKSTCNYCGTEFIAKTTKTRYCSHKCNSRDYKEKLRTKKVKQELNYRNRSTQIEKLKYRDYLSVNETAALIGCSTKTVYRLVNDGTIKSVNLSKRLTRINKRSLDKVIPQ